MKIYYIETGNIKWQGEAENENKAAIKAFAESLNENSTVGIITMASDVGFDADLNMAQRENQLIILSRNIFMKLLPRVDKDSQNVINNWIVTMEEAEKEVVEELMPPECSLIPPEYNIDTIEKLLL